jgi:hypothetical protein
VQWVETPVEGNAANRGDGRSRHCPQLRRAALVGILGHVNPGGRHGFGRWAGQDIDEQRRRLRDVPIDDRLREVLAWSAVVLADHLARSDAAHRRVEPPDPVGLGSRRS